MILLKKITVFFMLTLFSFAASFETISCFYQKSNQDFNQLTSDFSGEEKNSDQERPDEKTKKSKYDDDLFFSSELFVSFAESMYSHTHSNLNYSSSAYSQVVYSPPEQL